MSCDHSREMANQAEPSNVIPFPRRESSHGTISIYPCSVNGGEWAVEHVARSGDSAAFLGTYFSYDLAARFARQWAAKTGADFSDGGDAA
jgi:hypothetical protein